jgi:predicted DsbA family dithiol-disulfide isomerase/uncharacterized ParB-like nuclease family protein
MSPRLAVVSAIALCLVVSCRRDPDKVAPLADESKGDAATKSSATAMHAAKPGELPGVDTLLLTPTEKKQLDTILEQQFSPCGDVVSVAQCVREERACARCLPEAQAAARLVHAGEDDAAILDWLTNRFDDTGIKKIPVAGCATEGATSPTIPIVEFMDFECPHCAAAGPILRKIGADPKYATVVSLTVKMFPLSSHVHAFDAARAAVAADAQGKFFAVYDLLLANQDHLEAADLDKWARTAGVDFPKWKKAFADPATKAHVDTDKKDGDTLGILGVPSIYIGGRKFDSIGPEEVEKQLRAWIDLDLALMGKK